MADTTLILSAFRRNARVNTVLLSTMTSADLDINDSRGGWSVGQHLGHLAGFRAGWLSHISPAHASGLPEVVAGTEENFWLTTRDVAQLAHALDKGDEAALNAVQAALDEGRGFEGVYTSHPTGFLMHTVVHDSHHRGQIMSLLRQGGRSPEEMDALDRRTWAIWRE
ncbi:DinB family protein [Deinococcus deserti]|uniref:Putative DinB family protein n=1 Tax=Deinococcus deserti (strain DSM 17065 / CIP 109153 / LMG 22923 / VCD115) TaxID=546414 RepID=C1CY89_DEIDV|nr:DinB family protein [Deinococcus deserti]ACO44910.1 putative DinB family protein [Deinococcus deserti VCD115]